MPSKILIIDDELDVLRLLKFRLEKSGYEVITALDGIKGVELALNEKPSLIIIDIMMPGGDGYGVCEKLKHLSATAAIPVIFLSAKTQDRDVIKGYKAGAIFYLKKPYDPDLLLDAVKKTLEAPQESEKEARNKIKKFSVLTGDPALVRAIEENFNELFNLNFVKWEIGADLAGAFNDSDAVLLDLSERNNDFLKSIRSCTDNFKKDATLVLVTDFLTQALAEEISSGTILKCEKLIRPFEIGSLELLLRDKFKN